MSKLEEQGTLYILHMPIHFIYQTIQRKLQILHLTAYILNPSTESKMTTIEMRVHMDCVGCESRVKSALQKMRGVDEVEIDMVQQKVTVTGYADQKKVLKKVRKTGRRAELWQLPFNPDHSSLLGGGSNSTNGGYFYNPHGCNGPINHHAPVPGSSYNYYKHGYDSNDHSSYQHHPVHASIFSHQAGSKFSDENPNACSIM